MSTFLSFTVALSALLLAVTLGAAPVHAKRELAPSLGLDVDMPDDAETTLTERFKVVHLKARGILLYVHRLEPNDKVPTRYVEGIAASMTQSGKVAPGYERDGIVVQPIFMPIKGVPHRGVLAYLPRTEGGILVQALMPKSTYSADLDRLAILMVTSSRLISSEATSKAATSTAATPTASP